MGVSVKFRKNPRFEAQAKELLLSALPPILQQISAASQRRSPFEFGTNRRSITGEQTSETKGNVHTESGYGGWLHEGTRRNNFRRRPYITEGAEFVGRATKDVKTVEQLDSPLPDPGTAL